MPQNYNHTIYNVLNYLKRCWTPPFGALEALKIVKNGLEMRRLWLPKVVGSRTQNNKPQPIFEHPRKSFYVAMLLIEFKDYL